MRFAWTLLTSHIDEVITHAITDPLNKWYVPLVSLTFHQSPSFISLLTYTRNEALHGPLLHLWKSHGSDVITPYASIDHLSKWYVPLVPLSFHLSPTFISPLTYILTWPSYTCSYVMVIMWSLHMHPLILWVSGCPSRIYLFPSLPLIHIPPHPIALTTPKMYSACTLLHLWMGHECEHSGCIHWSLSRWYVPLVSLSFHHSPSCVNLSWLSLIPMYALWTGYSSTVTGVIFTCDGSVSPCMCESVKVSVYEILPSIGKCNVCISSIKNLSDDHHTHVYLWTGILFNCHWSLLHVWWICFSMYVWICESKCLRNYIFWCTSFNSYLRVINPPLLLTV